MILPSIVTGFTIGILGSFHCIGMCGPIALSLPVYELPGWQRMLYVLLYNLGRVTAYALMGVLFGLLGKQFFIGGYQQVLSIVLGVLILLVLFFSKYLDGNKSFFNTFTNFIKRSLSNLLKNEKKFYTYILIGFLNGFLPCGLVYIAIAGAIATGNILHSSLFMAAFGLGTFPVMVTVTVLGNFISIQWRNQMRKAVPVFVGVMAILLILRGLNLGLPYISPSIEHTHSGTEAACCHKPQ